MSEFDQQRFEGLLRKGCEQLDLTVTDGQVTALVRYLGLLAKWNKAFNLTAVRHAEEMLERHLLDSLSVVPHVTAARVLDVGTGPGLPGIPLAIMYPDHHFTLLDSNSKKTRFLTQCQIELGLKNIEVIQGRVEALQNVSPFEQITCRAFTSIANMLDWCKHLLTEKGQFIAMKGPLAMEEWQEADQSGFVLKDRIDLQVPGCEGERQLIMIGRAGV